MNHILDTDQKALQLNLDSSIYGTFAEIGAGQEVARRFFKVGAAAGTIAKSMSAYDKIYSDRIYGEEASRRYVCQSRLHKMLHHEYNLLEERLDESRPDTKFFVFANTITTINYQRTSTGHGWLGMRFQLTPTSAPNDLILHVKMLDNNTQQQADAIGILGVNMVHACYNHADDPEQLIKALNHNLYKRVLIDHAQLKGPDFDFDSRLVSYWLVKHGLSHVAMFNAQGQSIHASEFLYKKNLLLIKGNFRPFTLVMEALTNAAYSQFCEENKIKEEDGHLLLEITYKGGHYDPSFDDEKDFLDRADILNSLGHSIVISNHSDRIKLIKYLSLYKLKHIGIALGAKKMQKYINATYEQYRNTRLLAQFGKLFRDNVTVYVYPSVHETPSIANLLKTDNLPVPEGMKYLYQHIVEAGRMKDIKKYDPLLLNIYAKKVMMDLKNGNDDWEKCVSPSIAKMIKEKKMLGYK